MNKTIFISLLIIIGLFAIGCSHNDNLQTNLTQDEKKVSETENETKNIEEEENLNIEENNPPTETSNNTTPLAYAEEKTFIECLADAGMVVYGSATCPACGQFAQSLGGYDKIAPIYVECTIEGEKCMKGMQTNYVPEIQINGAVYEGSRSPAVLAEITGCEAYFK